MKPKIIGIVGPTASGKSDLAVKLARKFNGEVISADSRQVYKGLDIGTGKVSRDNLFPKTSSLKLLPRRQAGKTHFYMGVLHHLLDVANPKRKFTVADYKKLGEKAIEQILKRKKLPIVCGGTGLYIDSLLRNIDFPDVPPSTKLREKLSKLSAPELYKKLRKLDPRRAKEIDRNNPRRLIRALEIATALGTVPRMKKQDTKYDVRWIGIKPSDEMLKKKIHIRLIARLKQGMISEARNLHKQGLSFKRMDELGLEYRYLAMLIQKKISRKQFIIILEKEIWKYSKRQMTWFKKNKDIKWFSSISNVKVEP